MTSRIQPAQISRWELEKLRSEAESVLDERSEVGFRRFQLWLWLLFEDASHSRLARVMQSWIYICIFLSTFLELFMSYTRCEWKPWYEVSFQLSGENMASMHYAPGVSSATYRLAEKPAGMPDIVRVCEPRSSMADEWPGYFILDAICVLSFTLEYLCRLVGSFAVTGLGPFLIAPMNIIDLLAIIPFYIELPLRISVMACRTSGEIDCLRGGTDLSFLKVVRLIRIARILKATKSMHGLQVLIRTLQLSARPILMLFIFIGTLCALFASLAFAFDGVGPFISDISFNAALPPDDPRSNFDYGVTYNVDSSPTTFSSNLMGWYWCVQTLTSVGYGDMFPLTVPGKIIGIFAAFCGVIVLALPITIIGANFDEEYERSIKMIAFQRSSRVVRYQQASRFGTRTPRPPRVYKHWMDHFLPWAEPAPLEPTWDDQEYNIQADVSMLVESHFRLMRTKVVASVGKLSQTMTQKVQTDLGPVLESATKARRQQAAIAR